MLPGDHPETGSAAAALRTPPLESSKPEAVGDHYRKKNGPSTPGKVALALWLVIGGMLVAFTFNAPHSAPGEFLIPRSEPLTWIIPAIIFGPPLLLLVARRAPPRLASLIDWSVLVVLAGLFAAFHLLALLGR